MKRNSCRNYHLLFFYDNEGSFIIVTEYGINFNFKTRNTLISYKLMLSKLVDDLCFFLCFFRCV